MRGALAIVLIYVIFESVRGSTVEVTLANEVPNCHCNDKIACVRKCCEPKYVLPGEVGNCTYDGTDEFAFNMTSDNANPKVCYKYGIMDCKDKLSYYRLDATNYEDDLYEIKPDGNLWMSNLETLHDADEYCIENFRDMGVSVYLCIRAEAIDSGSVYAVGMIISLPFLFVTFLVHVLLPVKTIHTRCLIGFSLALFFSYFLLVCIEYWTDFSRTGCLVIGMLCVLSFMLSFLWTNAMSFDIWLTFSGRTRGFGRNRQKEEKKRFLYYFAYANGLGAIHVLIILSLTLWGDPDTWYNPQFGVDKCWFKENMGVLLYFYGPLAIIIIVNIAFFLVTTWKIKKTQKDTAVLRQGESKSSADDERFRVFLKLLLAMGGNWSLELISFVWEWQIGEVSKILTYSVDICNVLYGVIVFFLFTFKMSHWVQLQKRFPILKKIRCSTCCQGKKEPAPAATEVEMT